MGALAFEGALLEDLGFGIWGLMESESKMEKAVYGKSGL
jgi:hypothetical protein